MIALDTNILVYAHRPDSPWHQAASEAVRELAESGAAWAIPWPCLHELVAIVTHPRIYKPPSSLSQAIDQVEAWLESPSLHLLGEGASHWPTLRDLLRRGRAAGPLVHDARIAAICRDHGVQELWSADRDFLRFPNLRVRNPLIT